MDLSERIKAMAETLFASRSQTTPRPIRRPALKIALGGPAAQAAYRIAEIRQAVLQLLSPSDLASFIRVEKGCFADVARVLYSKVDIRVAEACVVVDSARQPVYTTSIIELDARSMPISSSMLELPCWHEHFEEEEIVVEYCPITFNFIVPYLRFRYPSLRKIRFGRLPSLHDGEGMYEWTVSFDSANDIDAPLDVKPTYDECGYVGHLGGHIAFFPTLDFWLDHEDEPPEALSAPTLPRGSYTLQHQFDLTISNQSSAFNDVVSSELYDRWAAAVKSGRGFENLHRRIDLHRLALSLDDLTSFYLKQAGAGHTARLQVINARRLAPWRIDDFTSFAIVASNSLTTLHISGEKYDNRTPRPTLTFGDLPKFISTVRTFLPNLRELSMGLDTIDGAEAICKGMLTPDSLAEGGTVADLNIEVGLWNDEKHYTPVFNIIRVLSALCTGKAQIAVTGSFRSCRPIHQTQYLHYLRQQSPARQAHLATVEFTLGLGNTRLCEVLQLDYKEDGRPVKVEKRPPGIRVEGDAADWSTKISAARAAAASFDPTVLAQSLASGRLNEISATVPAWEKLALAERVLGMTIPLRSQPGWLGRCKDVGEVRDHIEALKREEAEQEAENAGM